MVCASNTSADGNITREKALQIATHLGVDIFTGSDVWINKFKRRHSTVYRTLAYESRSAESETAHD
jgi:hypothetical protein